MQPLSTMSTHDICCCSLLLLHVKDVVSRITTKSDYFLSLKFSLWFLINLDFLCRRRFSCTFDPSEFARNFFGYIFVYYYDCLDKKLLWNSFKIFQLLFSWDSTFYSVRILDSRFQLCYYKEHYIIDPNLNVSHCCRFSFSPLCAWLFSLYFSCFSLWNLVTLKISYKYYEINPRVRWGHRFKSL